MPSGDKTMAKLIQRKGRSGYYLHVPIPRLFRDHFRCPAVIRKAGNTKAEVLIKRAGLFMEIEKLSCEVKGLEPIGEAMKNVIDQSDELFMEVISQSLPCRCIYTDKDLGLRLDAAISGSISYTEWIAKRPRSLPLKTSHLRSSPLLIVNHHP